MKKYFAVFLFILLIPVFAPISAQEKNEKAQTPEPTQSKLKLSKNPLSLLEVDPTRDFIKELDELTTAWILRKKELEDKKQNQQLKNEQEIYNSQKILIENDRNWTKTKRELENKLKDPNFKYIDLDSIGDKKKGVWLVSLEKEARLGAEIDQMLIQTLKPVENPVINTYIHTLVANLAQNSDAKKLFPEIHTKVLESPEVNALTTFGGYLYVNIGLILEAENEAQLAGVLAHEIAHIGKRHAAGNLSKAYLVQLPIRIAGRVFGGILGGIGSDILAAKIGIDKGKESEADKLGMSYAAKTGFDPLGFLQFFSNLAEKNKKRPGWLAGFFATHPSADDRFNQNRITTLYVLKKLDKEEYVLNSTAFMQIQTLTRRLYGATTTQQMNKQSQERGRPTLRRKAPDTNPPDKTDQNKPDPDSEKDKKEPPPTLKRRQPEEKP
ncbi:MAG: M48 family metalloprotease [Parcubacteria group bacterium]|nr:M48 family metalloprotease [Parcubacteria group bacterium]